MPSLRSRTDGPRLPAFNTHHRRPGPGDPALLGGPEHHRAWIVPPDLPKDGVNRIELTLRNGAPGKIVFLDLAMP